MRPRDVIAKRFDLLRLAGRGGMSEVWQARDLVEGGLVAIKAMTEVTPRHRTRFLREGHLLAELRHPAIVRYVAHGVSESGLPYLAMEWLEGRSLSERLAGGAISTAETLELGLRIAEALGAAHAIGVVHRDVKPSNVFLVDGAVRSAKLLDFGVARLGAGPTLTRAGALLGTPAFMAPEQVRRADEVDPRADV